MNENQRHTQPPRFSVTEEDRGGVMDARDAFCIAVKFYRSGDWNPALPTFEKS